MLAPSISAIASDETVAPVIPALNDHELEGILESFEDSWATWVGNDKVRLVLVNVGLLEQGLDFAGHLFCNELGDLGGEHNLEARVHDIPAHDALGVGEEGRPRVRPFQGSNLRQRIFTDCPIPPPPCSAAERSAPASVTRLPIRDGPCFPAAWDASTMRAVRARPRTPGECILDSY